MSSFSYCEPYDPESPVWSLEDIEEKYKEFSEEYDEWWGVRQDWHKNQGSHIVSMLKSATLAVVHGVTANIPGFLASYFDLLKETYSTTKIALAYHKDGRIKRDYEEVFYQFQARWLKENGFSCDEGEIV